MATLFGEKQVSSAKTECQMGDKSKGVVIDDDFLEPFEGNLPGLTHNTIAQEIS